MANHLVHTPRAIQMFNCTSDINVQQTISKTIAVRVIHRTSFYVHFMPFYVKHRAPVILLHNYISFKLLLLLSLSLPLLLSRSRS